MPWLIRNFSIFFFSSVFALFSLFLGYFIFFLSVASPLPVVKLSSLLPLASRQLAVSLFGIMIGKMRNTYEHQRVSDGKIQMPILILRRGPCLLASSFPSPFFDLSSFALYFSLRVVIVVTGQSQCQGQVIWNSHHHHHHDRHGDDDDDDDGNGYGDGDVRIRQEKKA